MKEYAESKEKIQPYTYVKMFLLIDFQKNIITSLFKKYFLPTMPQAFYASTVLELTLLFVVRFTIYMQM